MIKAVLFDLDGTLLGMDNNKFILDYFKSILSYMAKYGYEINNFKEAMYKGTMDIIKNDGKKLNEEVFLNTFMKELKNPLHSKEELLNIFDEYYQNEFDYLAKDIKVDNNIAKLIDFIKDKGLKVIIATAPVFPKEAVEKRIAWINYKYDDFDYVTNYSNCKYCKPNPKYYLDILKRYNLNSDEVLMVGNDVNDDMRPCLSLGIDCFLIEGFTLNDKGYKGKRGNFLDLYNYLKEVL